MGVVDAWHGLPVIAAESVAGARGSSGSHSTPLPRGALQSPPALEAELQVDIISGEATG